MKAALLQLLPRLAIDPADVTIIAHQGVSDLEASLPRKLRAWLDPNARFLILRDNDRGNCHVRKTKLVAVATAANRAGQSKVRIVCQELEAWFIGDAQALEASGQLRKPLPKRLRTCDPDVVPYPSVELKKLNSGYGKISGAEAIAQHLDPANNRSTSFRHTIDAIRKLMVA